MATHGLRRPSLPSSPLHLASGLILMALLTFAAQLPGQGVHMQFSPDSIEALLRADFEMLQWGEGLTPRVRRVMLGYDDYTAIITKWAKAPAGGGDVFNNRPRYEVAAYEAQKLFLDPSEYVVPPTVARCVNVDQQRQIEKHAEPTLEGSETVVVVLQYWLQNVKMDDVWDKGRFEKDTLYARHYANMDLFTYLILHGDSNKGNVLVSSIDAFPRVFAVDNGVAFARDEQSDRGIKWRDLDVDRLPRATVDRLRAITLEDLQRELSVVAQFQQRGHEFVDVEPSEPFEANKGVRRSEAIVQLGLTESEIKQMWDRINKVLERVDEGDISLF
jgi:hypothetical protein